MNCGWCVQWGVGGKVTLPKSLAGKRAKAGNVTLSLAKVTKKVVAVGMSAPGFAPVRAGRTLLVKAPGR